MCLYVNSKAEVKTANKPILVWKFIDEYKYDSDIWLSPYYSFVDIFNKYGELVIAKKMDSNGKRQPLEDLKFEPVYHFKYKNLWAKWFRRESSYQSWVENPKKKVIREGLHAFRSKHRAIKWSENSVVRPAIIPVGARYVKGKDGEIVSTQLIVCKTLEDAKRIINEQK